VLDFFDDSRVNGGEGEIGPGLVVGGQFGSGVGVRSRNRIPQGDLAAAEQQYHQQKDTAQQKKGAPQPVPQRFIL
jgi:hypothetical protein